MGLQIPASSRTVARASVRNGTKEPADEKEMGKSGARWGGGERGDREYKKKEEGEINVSRYGLAVRRVAGRQKDLGSIHFGSPFSSLQKLWFMDTVL